MKVTSPKLLSPSMKVSSPSLLSPSMKLSSPSLLSPSMKLSSPTLLSPTMKFSQSNISDHKDFESKNNDNNINEIEKSQISFDVTNDNVSLSKSIQSALSHSKSNYSLYAKTRDDLEDDINIYSPALSRELMKSLNITKDIKVPTISESLSDSTPFNHDSNNNIGTEPELITKNKTETEILTEAETGLESELASVTITGNEIESDTEIEIKNLKEKLLSQDIFYNNINIMKPIIINPDEIALETSFDHKENDHYYPSKDLINRNNSGILRNKRSNPILKNNSILKNKNSEISNFPVQFDHRSLRKINSRLSMESRKSKVSFCESKNMYREVIMNKSNFSKRLSTGSSIPQLKRLSAGSSMAPYKRFSIGSSMAPYIIEKSLNQTTILNESSIRFDNYSTTETFTVLKGNFNDESMSEMNFDLSHFGSQYNESISSFSSINVSYISDHKNIKAFDDQVLNNETNSSTTIYHHAKSNSLGDLINKKHSNQTFHKVNANINVNNKGNVDDDEIANFFENHSKNKRTSFIVFDKDNDLLKDDSIFEKDIQNTQGKDNTLHEIKIMNKESNFSKLRNDILTSSISKQNFSKINDSYDTHGFPSSTHSLNKKNNNRIKFKN